MLRKILDMRPTMSSTTYPRGAFTLCIDLFSATRTVTLIKPVGLMVFLFVEEHTVTHDNSL